MALHRIRMRHLRCFLAVSRAGSVTRAAEELGTVQPSVSRSIREFEDEVGVALFDRSGGGMVLNAAGETLYAHVSNGMGQVDHGIEAIRGVSGDRRVVVFALPNVVRMVMPGAVERFRLHRQDVELEIETIHGGFFAERMRRGDVDFALGRLNAVEQMEALNYEHLYSEPLVFYARAGHPLAGRRGLKVREVDAFEILLPTSGTIIRDEVDRFLIGQGLTRPQRALATISFEFARNYVMRTDALACQPLGAIRRELAAGDLTLLDFGTGQLTGSVGISVPSGRRLSAAAQVLVQSIREEVTHLGLS